MAHDPADPARSADQDAGRQLERVAVELANAAGAHLLRTLGTEISVSFKPPLPDAAPDSNLVSHVDLEIEERIRREILARFPDHDVIGEEQERPPGAHAEIVWVIDPLDGTTNFVNGVPLFGSSIGVLRHGRPVAGAIWCACTHTLRPGVYHAYFGGPLCFEGVPLERRPAGAWRGLAGEPGTTSKLAEHWDTRVLGSATLELAFVAAGLLRLARFARPRMWDVAAGVVLARSAGCEVVTTDGSRWIPLEGWTLPLRREWCAPVVVGDPAAVRIATADLAPTTPPI